MFNLSVDLGYLVDNGPIRLPFHVEPQKKFLWEFSTSPISCNVLKKQCSPSVWRASGSFHYSHLSAAYSRLPLVECDFIIRRYGLYSYLNVQIYESIIYLCFKKCRWSRRICRVEVEFISFNVGTDCIYNYLDIGGKNLCGNMSGRKSESFSFRIQVNRRQFQLFSLKLLMIVALEFPPNEDTLRLPLKHSEEVDVMMDVKQIQCR